MNGYKISRSSTVDAKSSSMKVLHDRAAVHGRRKKFIPPYYFQLIVNSRRSEQIYTKY